MKKARQFISILLICCLIVPLLQTATLATETDPITGTYGDNLTWSLDMATKTLTISGTGTMLDSPHINGAPWYDYRSNISSVVLTSGVESIGDHAFCGHNNLNSIDFPSSLTVIGSDAFSGCSSLTGIIIPNSITTIEDYAFASCDGLADITICGDSTVIGEHAFAWCDSLTDVTIEGGTIGESAFAECSKLVNVAIGNKVIAINDGAFKLCNSLRSILIPDNVISLGKQAFSSCQNLKDVTIGNGVTAIGESTFMACHNLSNVRIGNQVTFIGDHAFSCCCNSLTTITIPDSVQSIGSEAFENCGRLTGIAISRGVTSIGEGAFRRCTKLAKVVVDETNPSYCSDEFGVLFNKNKTELIQYPAGNRNSSYNIPDSVTTIGKYAFGGCYYLEVPVIGSGMTTIPEYAFYECNSMTSIAIPNQVTTIAPGAFYFCINLTNLTFGQGVNSIGENAFKKCDRLTDVYYPGTKEQWSNISIASNNDPLAAATIHYNNIADGNSSMIKTVKAYTSGELSRKVIEIFQSKDSFEVQFERLSKLYEHYGMSDVKEGHEYILASSAMRLDYEYLLKDESYCANDYTEKLHSDLAMRSVLTLSAFLIGGEINDWLDFSTYLQSEYPGVVKYKAALLDFMEQSSPKIEALEMAKEIQSAFSHVDKGITQAIVQSLETCESWDDYRAITDSNAMKEVYTQIDLASGQVSLSETSGFGQFAKAMGHAGTALKFGKLAYEDVMGLLQLNSTLKSYSIYQDFLEDIIRSTNDFPFEMRWAAQQILDELERNMKEVADGIVLDIIEVMYTATGLDSIVMESLKTKYKIVGSFSEWLLVVDITSWAINAFVDVSAMLERSATVEAYVLLADHWKKNLCQAANTFISTGNEENAWNFAYNYEILRLLRLKGEEAYLKMCDVEGILGELFEHQYAIKKDFVQPIIDRLRECRFSQFKDLEEIVGNQKIYAAKAVVECPVSVQIMDESGQTIVNIPDGEEFDIENEYGRFISTYQSYSNDYIKILYFNENIPYNVALQAENDGKVSYIANGNGEYVNGVYYQDLQAGDILAISAEHAVSQPSEVILYSGGDEAKATNLVVEQVPVDIQIPVQQIQLSNIELEPGNSQVIRTQFFPSNSAICTLIWGSQDLDIATVQNGVVTAVSEGETIIFANAIGSNILSKCTVTVTKPPETEVTITGVAAAQVLTYSGTPQQGYTGTPTCVYAGDYEIRYRGRNDTVYDSVDAPTNVGNYTVTIKIPDDDETYTGSVALEFTIEKGTQSAPAMPELEQETENRVTLKTTAANLAGATAEYSKDGTSWQDSTTFANLSAATPYLFYARYKGNDNYHPSAASVGAKIYTAAATPSVRISYSEETLSTTTALEYSTDSGASWSGCTENMTVHTFGWDGSAEKSIQLRVEAVENGAPASEAVAIVIPARPAAPSGLQGINETADGKNDGKITGISADMEYRARGAERWVACAGEVIDTLAPGSYEVRLKATSSAFAGTTALVTIATGTTCTYTINVVAPMIDPVIYGYEQPEAKPVTISSTGNSDATISSVILSGEHKDAFMLNKTTGCTITAGGTDDTTYTVRPVTGLKKGAYTATITATYNGGATATGTVTFRVNSAPQAAPEVPNLDSKTYNSVRLTAIAASATGAAAQYSRDGGMTWQSSPVFTELSAGTEYGFIAQYVATENYEASPASAVLKVTTDAKPSGENSTGGGSTGGGSVGGGSMGGSGNSSSAQKEMKLHFTDVPTGAWYEEAVRFVYEKGLMAGTGAATFSPDAATTRGMIATILYRLEGMPAVSDLSAFTDVTSGSYCADAVAWASTNGIVGGYGDGNFGPNDNITREQMSVMLYRYAGYKGYNTDVSADLSSFSDTVAISSFATEALRWAVGEGLISGKGNGILAPKGEASRAEVASVLMRYLLTLNIVDGA